MILPINFLPEPVVPTPLKDQPDLLFPDQVINRFKYGLNGFNRFACSIGIKTGKRGIDPVPVKIAFVLVDPISIPRKASYSLSF